MPGVLKRQSPKLIPALVIGGLVALNIILIGALLLRPQAPITAAPAPSPSGEQSSSAASAGESSTPSKPSTPSRKTSDKKTKETKSAPTTRLLAVSSSQIGWRASIDDCGKPGTVEVSTDGGKTWRQTDPQMGSLTRLKAYGENSLFAVGGDKDCDPAYATIQSPTGRWYANDSPLSETWYADPDGRDRVHAPGGRMSRPCGVDLVDLAGLGDNTAVALCADGKVKITENGAKTWRTEDKLRGGAAMNADDEDFIAAAVVDGCHGVAVRQFSSDGDGLNGKARCAPISDAKIGTVAVAHHGEVIWVWAADKVAVSTDGGKTW